MGLDQLRYFVAVVEEENVTRAARRLHVSQPPLSRRIRELEAEFGRDLFARTSRGLRLLPAGEALLVHARVILHEVARATDVVQAAREPTASAAATGSAARAAARTCGRRISSRRGDV